MNLQSIKEFLEGKKTASGLSLAVFTPMLTALLVSSGMTTTDSANLVNGISGAIALIITVYGIIDKHVRTHAKKKAP